MSNDLNIAEVQRDWTVKTERLSFRPYTLEDLPQLVELRADPEVNRYLGGMERQNPEALAKRLRFYISCYASHGFGMCPMILSETAEVVGSAGLQPLDGTDEIEVGYSLAKEHWGRGLATEAAIGWLDLGFRVKGLQRIVAVADVQNAASRRVLEKLGLTYEKTERHYGTECAFYAIAREAYLSSPADL